MKDHLRRLVRAVDPLSGRNLARECIQARILEGMQRAGARPLRPAAEAVHGKECRRRGQAAIRRFVLTSVSVSGPCGESRPDHVHAGFRDTLWRLRLRARSCVRAGRREINKPDRMTTAPATCTIAGVSPSHIQAAASATTGTTLT